MPAALSVTEIFDRIDSVHNGNVHFVGKVFEKGTRSAVRLSGNFQCQEGHKWEAPAFRIMRGHGCPVCAQSKKRKALQTDQATILDLIKDRFELLSAYTNMNAKADFLCLGCNREINIQLRQACYASYGCPHCANQGRAKIGGHSKRSIAWVDEIAKKLRLNFQHNENGGEALLELSLSNYRRVTPVDGYNHRYKIICEYDGDYWHKRHDRRTKAYKRTLVRTNRMLELGYVVIHIWGKDYEAGHVENVFCKDARGKAIARKLGANFLQTTKLEAL